MTKNLFKISIIISLLCLFAIACKEVNLTGDEIAWSLDGETLAFINVQTGGIYTSETSSLYKFMKIDSNAVIPQRLQWSADGENLIYLKTENEQIKLYIWQKSLSRSRFVANIAFKKQEDNLVPIAYPVWKGSKEQILFIETAQDGGLILKDFSIHIEQSHEIWKQKCDLILPVYVPEVERIFFSVKGAVSADLNGIWESETTAPRLIFSDADLVEFKISPDGRGIAVVTSNERYGTKKIKILSADLNFEHINVIFETDDQIMQIFWSPDGEKLAAVVGNKDKKNLFVINVMKETSKKITFDNLAKFYGWQKADDLFYAINFPESLVKLSGPRKDEKEFREISLGKEVHHQLICYNGKSFKRLGQNVEAYQENPFFGFAAYYQREKLNFLGDDIYLMTAEDSTSFPHLYPDESAEFLLAAEIYLSKYKVDKALDNLERYWGFDLRTTTFSKQFEIDQFLSGDKLDSSSIAKLAEAITHGAFAQSYISLQQAGLNKKADDLCRTLSLFSQKYLPQHKEKSDELMWGIITVFSRLSRYDEGIEFMERLMSIADHDSLAKSYFYLTQGIFSYKESDFSKGIEKFMLSAKFLPAEKNEVEPYNAFISICLSKDAPISSNVMEKLFDILVARFPDADNISTTYELMGDFYKREKDVGKALMAYRKSVIKNPEENRVWRKIFDLERRQMD